MADVAQDAFGPASPKPSDIASQQAGRPDLPDRGKLRVFISYSRDDLEFADQLDAALNAYGFECIIDRHGIAGGEDWKRLLGNLIREADTVVFVLSPSSARSPVCDWEVEEATRLGKRILPVNCRPLEGASPPPRLRERNYIFFHADPRAAPDAGFGRGLASLVAALNTDLDWLREHTRYLQRATEWNAVGRPPNRLLSGDDIADAKAWVARRPKNAPEPTALHLDFIRASEEEAEARSSAQRKQLEAMAAAQAERETALHEAEEALKQAADAQRKRATTARIKNIAFVVVGILGVLAGLLGWRAEQQRVTADKLRQVAQQQRTVAEEQRALAEKQRVAAEEQRAAAQEQKEYADHILQDATGVFVEMRDRIDIGTAKRVVAVFQTGANHGHVVSMYNLGLSYELGLGVAQDYVKAREWYEKAADKGLSSAMVGLGGLYENGYGVAQDFTKAREWYEKAEATEKVDARTKEYINGLAVRKAAKEASAKFEALALRKEEEEATKVEKEETKRQGKPGAKTAQALVRVARSALLAQEFTKALTVTDRAHALFPDDLMIETNRAHALMFLGRTEESKALYLAHKGKPVSSPRGELWERIILEDFSEFRRKADLTHPMIPDILKELGVSQ